MFFVWTLYVWSIFSIQLYFEILNIKASVLMFFVWTLYVWSIFSIQLYFEILNIKASVLMFFVWPVGEVCVKEAE